MARPQVALVPSHLATPPMLWTPHDVKSWLEFCVKEFSLRPVCLDKFDLNGKALLLLTRTDFIERAPHAGDILYNVFQRLLQQEGPAYLRSPIFLPAPAHFLSPGADTLPRPLPAQNGRSLYIPIRPQPQAPVCSSISNATCSNSGSLIFSVDEETSTGGPGVPASMLSPAPSEKCSSDVDSANNESGHSPHGSDHEMDYEESMNFDPGREIKYDTSDQNDDGVCRLLWEFIYQLLQDNKWSELVSWESIDDLTFRIQNPTNLADAWGKQKNRSNMTYEKLSRALRYYYKMNIIKKVQGKRLTYKFLQHPAKIRKGQRGARPHSSKGQTPRESDTEPTSTEGITPDSSTFLPSGTTSPPASLNAAAAATSNEYSSSIASPKREYISDEPQEINTAEYDKGNHFLRSCVDIKSANQIQSPFILHDAVPFGPSKTAQNIIRAHSVSPGKHLLAMQICQDRFCSVNEKGESNNSTAECRSQLTRLNASPEMLRRPWTFQQAETNSSNISSVSLVNESFRDDCSMNLASSEEKLRLFDVSEPKMSRQKSEQELRRDIDRYSSLPESLRFVSNLPRRISPVQFSLTKSHNGIVPSFLYSGDSFHHNHPSSYSQSFNQTTAHSSYTHVQRRPNQTSPGGYSLQNNEFIDHPSAIFSYPADLSLQGPQDSFQIKHTLKQESYDQVQEEPEDLSMKQVSRQDGLGKKVKSESDLSLVTRLKDVNRDSPRSCSADSAYSSDRAEFGKDVSVDRLHE